VAKAILDDRLLDLPFSQPFYKLLLNKSLTLRDLITIKPEFVYLLDFVKIYRQKKKILNDKSLSPELQRKKINELKYDGKSISEMDLSFCLGSMKLKEDGDNIDLTIDNLEEFVDLIALLFLSKGIEKQIMAFKEGFEYFLPINTLQLFSPDELDLLICGTPEDIISWTPNEIIENAKFEGGYSSSSRTVIYLANVLVSFNIEQRRRFLQFLTGSPRLPVGGLKSLRPKLTIQLRKNILELPDNCFPSVNTCFLFLKLPEYSSEDILREKLIMAMENGHSAFDFH
jgi:E3 ubiquitin-protein ligase TRIP12